MEEYHLERIEKLRESLIDAQILSKFCFCGSGEEYQECCQTRDYPLRLTPDLIKQYQEIILHKKIPLGKKFTILREKLTNKECIYKWCSRPPIDSHFYSRKHLKNSIGSQIGLFNWSPEWRLTPDTKWVNTVTRKAWCKNHDASLFNLTDQYTFNEIPQNSKIKRAKYLQELCYKCFWIWKINYVIDQKIYFLNYMLRIWTWGDLIIHYQKYDTICTLYQHENKLQINLFLEERAYFFLEKSTYSVKLFHSAPLFTSPQNIPYILYFYPWNNTLHCLIIRTLNDDPLELTKYIHNKIKTNNLDRLRELADTTLTQWIWGEKQKWF